jgi:hemolysin activation/secretion protein
MQHKSHNKKTYFNYAIALALISTNANYTFASSELSNATQKQINASAAGRFDYSDNGIFLNDNKKLSITKMLDAYQYPKSSKNYKFNLKKVIINGNTVFSSKELNDIYAQYLNNEITLDKVWYFAQKITELYQAKGYFLTRSYIPAQEIENGVVKINIVEGYIAKVDIKDNLASNRLVKQLINKLEAARPINTKTLENIIMQLNDLKGTEYKAVLHRLDNANLQNGAAQVTITPAAKDYHAFASVDNQSSKFLGPYQFMGSYSKNFFGIQKTRMLVAFDPSLRKTKHIDLEHIIPFALNWKFSMLAAYDKNQPKSSLNDFNTESYAKRISPSVIYSPIKQQDKNLALSLALDIKNTETKINSNTILSKDKIRAIRTKLNYTFLDMFNSFNAVDITLSKGLTSLGASKKHDEKLSKSYAKPNFLTMEANYSRQDSISNQFVSITRLSTQLSSSSLYSSEQFSYGGKNYGQAYDPNEFSGDSGVSASVEILYTKLKAYHKTSMYPYVLYNIGQVKQKHKVAGEKNKQNAATVGFGVKFEQKNGFSGNLGIAWPLISKVSNPIRGNGKSPRIILSTSYKF